MAQTHVSNDPVALRQTHMNSTRCSALWHYSMVNMWKPVDTSIVTRDTSSAEWKPIVLVDTSEQHPPTAHAIIPTFTTCFVPRTLHPIHIPRNPLSYHTPPQVHSIPTSCTAPSHMSSPPSLHSHLTSHPVCIPSHICHPFCNPFCHPPLSSIHHPSPMSSHHILTPPSHLSPPVPIAILPSISQPIPTNAPMPTPTPVHYTPNLATGADY